MRNVQLTGAKLVGIKLASTNLEEANLTGASLLRANLADANLQRANLSGAELSRTYLSGANLSSANLTNADLRGANLLYANLSGADLSNASLNRSYLSYVNFSQSNLNFTDLVSSVLVDVNWTEAQVERARFGKNRGLLQQQQQNLENRRAIFNNSSPSSPNQLQEASFHDLPHEIIIDAQERIFDFEATLNRYRKSVKYLNDFMDRFDRRGNVNLKTSVFSRSLGKRIQEANNTINKSQDKLENYKTKYINEIQNLQSEDFLTLLQEISQDISETSQCRRAFEEILIHSSSNREDPIYIETDLQSAKFDISLTESKFSGDISEESIVLNDEDVANIQDILRENF
jgi:uncharacterized protein YjbI with pentapeptide repeats